MNTDDAVTSNKGTEALDGLVITRTATLGPWAEENGSWYRRWLIAADPDSFAASASQPTSGRFWWNAWDPFTLDVGNGIAASMADAKAHADAWLKERR